MSEKEPSNKGSSWNQGSQDSRRMAGLVVTMLHAVLHSKVLCPPVPGASYTIPGVSFPWTPGVSSLSLWLKNPGCHPVYLHR